MTSNSKSVKYLVAISVTISIAISVAILLQVLDFTDQRIVDWTGEASQEASSTTTPSKPSSDSMPDTSRDFKNPFILPPNKTASLHLKPVYADIHFKDFTDLKHYFYGSVKGKKSIFTKENIRKEKFIDRLEQPIESCNDASFLLFNTNLLQDTADPFYPFQNIQLGMRIERCCRVLLSSLTITLLFSLGSRLFPKLRAFEYQMKLNTKMMQDEAKKHFHEIPGHNHLDKRFGNKSLDSFRESEEPNAVRSKHLKLLLTAWALFCDQNHIPYNIAHGLLIGWVWNKQLLPWDNDLDVNIPANYLKKLSEFGNKTYFSRYLLDVCPEYTYRRESNVRVLLYFHNSSFSNPGTI